MTTPASPDIHVFRPSPAARQRTVLYSLIPAIPLVFITVLNSAVQPQAAPVFLALFALAAALIVPYLIWYLRTTRFEFGDGHYRYVTTFIRREFDAGDVERIVAVDEVHYGLNGARMLFLVGRTRRRLFRLNSVAWDTAQLEAVINDLLARGVPLTHIPGRVTPGELDRREPGLLRWVEAHRVAFAFIVGFGAILLVVVLLVVIVAIFIAR